MSKLLDVCRCPVCNKPINIGLLVEGNAYFGDDVRYLQMNQESLKMELDMLAAARKCAFKAFIFHPTVPWFLACLLTCLICLFLGFWRPHSLSVALSVATLFSLCAFIQAVLRMNKKRQALQDGLKMLGKQIKIVEGCLAIREVLAKEETWHGFPGADIEAYRGAKEPAL